MIYKKWIKPIVELSAVLLILIITSPIFLLCVIFLFVSNRGKVFFIQERVGKNERIFRIIKFKTMNDSKDREGNLLSDDERLTVVGSFIRKLSLDELPQIINVLKGEMSLVGPRPLLIEYLPLYNAEQRKRHWVKPGITGWAQINGRNSISWAEKFKLDIWYVNNLSFGLDIKILCLTIFKVFSSVGISPVTSVTMEKFTGQCEEVVNQ